MVNIDFHSIFFLYTTLVSGYTINNSSKYLQQKKTEKEQDNYFLWTIPLINVKGYMLNLILNHNPNKEFSCICSWDVITHLYYALAYITSSHL